MINRNSCRESSPVTLQFTMSGCRLMKICSLSVCVGGNISQALCSRRPVTLNTVSKNVWISRVKSQEFGEENSNVSLVFVLPVLTTASPRYSGNTFLNYWLKRRRLFFLSGLPKSFEIPGVHAWAHHVPAAHYNRSFLSFSHSFVWARQFGSTGDVKAHKGSWERGH